MEDGECKTCKSTRCFFLQIGKFQLSLRVDRTQLSLEVDRISLSLEVGEIQLSLEVDRTQLSLEVGRAQLSLAVGEIQLSFRVSDQLSFISAAPTQNSVTRMENASKPFNCELKKNKACAPLYIRNFQFNFQEDEDK